MPNTMKGKDYMHTEELYHGIACFAELVRLYSTLDIDIPKRLKGEDHR